MAFKGSLISQEKRYQLAAAIAATMGGICIGTMFAWPSPAILSMVERGSDLNMSIISWIASISMLGAFFTTMPAAIMMEKFGGRITIVISSVLFLIGWIIIATSSTAAALLAGRFITGLGGGGYSMSIPAFVGEIAQTDVRRKLSSLFPLQVIIGIFLTYVLGSCLSWIWLSCLCASVPVLHFVAMNFIPESPIFILSQEKQDKAIESLEWFRGVSRLNDDLKPNKEMQEELATMEKLVEYRKHQTLQCSDLFPSHSTKLFIISLGMICFHQFSGVGIAVVYPAFQFKTIGSNWDLKISLIIMGVVQVLAALLSTLLVDRVARKVQIIASLTVMALSYVALGSFFYVKENNGGNAPSSIEWVPIVSLIVYAALYSMGIGPLSLLYQGGDLLPQGRIGLASAISNSVNWISAFIVIKTYDDLSISLGKYGCFWLFASICLLGSLYTFLIVPETKEQSLEEILEKLEYPGSKECDIEISRL